MTVGGAARLGRYPATVEFRKPRTALVRGVVLGVVLVAASLFLVLYPTPGPRRGLALVGWLGLALFGVATVILVVRLFMRRGSLLLDADGFTDTTSATAVGFVPWSEVMVTTTRTVGRATMVGVELADPQGFVDRLPSLPRATARMNLRTFGTPVWIAPSGLAEPDVLAALIYEYRAGWVASRRWDAPPSGRR